MIKWRFRTLPFFVVLGLVFLSPVSAQQAKQQASAKCLHFDSEYSKSNRADDFGNSFVSWNANETEIVQRLVSHISSKFPGLIYSAELTSDLSLRRIHGCWGPRASTSDGAINFYDSFFTSDDQLGILLHELVHVADQDYRVSLSPEWISFASPAIDTIRLNADFMNRQAVKQYEANLVRTNVWPSVYGVQDLEEALAEYFVAFATNPQFVCNKTFLVNVLPNLLQASDSQRQFSKQLRLAVHALEENRISVAKKGLLFAAELDADSPLPHYLLTKCYIREKNYKLAIVHSSKALQRMEEIHVPHYEATSQFMYRTRGWVQMKLGKYRQAIDDFSTCLESNPNDLNCYFQRAICRERIGLFGDALQDYLYSKGYNPYRSNIFRDSLSNPLFALRSAEMLIKTNRTADSYYLLALIQEFLSDSAKLRLNQNYLYSQASLSYKTALSKEPSRIELLVRLAETEYKLGNVRESLKLCDEILRASPKEISALVYLFRLVGATDSQSKLKPQFYLLRSKILSMRSASFYKQPDLVLLDWADNSSIDATSFPPSSRRKPILRLFEGQPSDTWFKQVR